MKRRLGEWEKRRTCNNMTQIGKEINSGKEADNKKDKFVKFQRE